MSTGHVFTQVLKSVESVLKREGFARAKRLFWVERASNIGVVDVQKSSKSTGDQTIFTFNIGVWSDRIGRFVTSNRKSKPPEVDDCHWRERVGFLLPGRNDKWWTIGESDDPTRVSQELGAIIEDVAVPAVMAHISDDALRDEWLAGQSPGLTDMQRLMYLSILLSDIGPRDALADVIAELQRKSEGKPIEAVVTKHVQKLRWN